MDAQAIPTSPMDTYRKEGSETYFTEIKPMPPNIKQIEWVYFLPNLFTQKGSEKEKPNVTKFKMAEVVLAYSSPCVYKSLLVVVFPPNISVATPVL